MRVRTRAFLQCLLLFRFLSPLRSKHYAKKKSRFVLLFLSAFMYKIIGHKFHVKYTYEFLHKSYIYGERLMYDIYIVKTKHQSLTVLLLVLAYFFHCLLNL